MIKRITALVVILILSLPVSVLAAESGNGTIEGQVVNKSIGGSNVADVEVQLITNLNNGEVGSATAQTDSSGRFVFDNLPTDSGYSYQVKLIYQEAEYFSEGLIFDEGETTKSVEVLVYDSTTSDEAIKVSTAHTIIYVEQGYLRVKEYFLFVNESDRTYVGSQEIAAEGRKQTLAFSIPQEVTEIELYSGLTEGNIYRTESGIVDASPVLPGEKEVSYSYKLKYDSGEYILSQKINYQTVKFNFLVQGEGIKIDNARLTVSEPLDMNGARFNYLSGEELAPGDTLVTKLSGLPQPSSKAVLIWVTLAIAVLAFGAIFIYLRRDKWRAQPITLTSGLEQRRQRLLAEIAQLDDSFEDGEVQDEVYRRERAIKKAQLVRLIKEVKRG